MGYNIIINGFHGTCKESADAICEKKTYTYTRREDHWLGQGIYFFREDSDQAMSWALNQTQVGSTACVLSTNINVESTSFLNLNTRDGIYKLKKMLETIDTQFEIDSKMDVDDHNHRYRCFIMDLLPYSIKAIQKNFTLRRQPKAILGNPTMKKMDVNMQSVQVCVRDASIIAVDSIKIYQVNEKHGRGKKRRRKFNFK